MKNTNTIDIFRLLHELDSISFYMLLLTDSLIKVINTGNCWADTEWWFDELHWLNDVIILIKQNDVSI